jgi:hypothetical protein
MINVGHQQAKLAPIGFINGELAQFTRWLRITRRYAHHRSKCDMLIPEVQDLSQRHTRPDASTVIGRRPQLGSLDRNCQPYGSVRPLALRLRSELEQRRTRVPQPEGEFERDAQ